LGLYYFAVYFCEVGRGELSLLLNRKQKSKTKSKLYHYCKLRLRLKLKLGLKNYLRPQARKSIIDSKLFSMESGSCGKKSIPVLASTSSMETAYS